FLGSLPNNTLPSFYNFVDCFVLPSLFEAFGITLIEAMSCGKTVIASNVGGIPEVVDDGYNGILIVPGNYISLKEAIIRIINDRNLRINLGNSARQKVVENFTIEKTYEELKFLYLNLLC
ncbi:MAG: glycosyltransferase family 4 protein, partial [Deltaproteobacteria bacterium]